MIASYFARSLGAPLSVLVLVFSAATSQPATADVRKGLTDVGFSALPTFLDAATDSITLKFPKAMGGGQLKFGGTIDADALKEKTFKFTTSAGHELQWRKAFGMPWLDLADVTMSLTIAKGDFDIQLDGKAGGILADHGKGREMALEIHVADKALADFTLSLPKSAFELADLPGLKNLPGAKDLKLESPVVSLGALGGKVAFKGEIVDLAAFLDEDKKAWNAAIRLEKPLTVGALVGKTKGLLAKVGLPEMRVLISEKGWKSDYGDLPLAVQAFFEEDDKLPDGDLELVSGVNIVADFDPAALSSDIKSALGKIGLDQKLEIDGEVQGMFGGEPSITLGVPLTETGGHAFAFLKHPPKVTAEFFIKLSKEEQALGFRTTVQLPGGKHNSKPLLFDVAFELDDKTSGIEVLVSGDMRGDWKNAIGIKGLTLENPFLSVGINETGAFDLMMDGSIIVGSEKVRATIDAVLQPGAAFLPEAVALAGEANKISFTDLTHLGKKHATLKGGGLKNVKAELRDLAFAFMTPGASLPADLESELHIEGAGMAMKAKLFINGKEAAEASGYVSTEGMKFDGKVSPVKAGPIDLKDAELDIQAGPNVDPKFVMKGDIKLFKGFEDKFDLELQPDHFLFSSDMNFGKAFQVDVLAESDGLKFGSGNDFKFEAELGANYDKAFKDVLKGAVKAFQKGEHDIGNAQKKVKAAEHKVASLNTKIKKAKADAEKAVKKATSKIDAAKKKVDGIKGTIGRVNKKIHDLKKSIKHDKKHWKVASAAKHGVQLAAQETALKADQAALKSADWALKTAKKAVKITPVNAAPKVVALTAERVTAEAALKVAEGVLDAAKAADKGFEAATKAVLKASSNFKINKIGVAGSLNGIKSGGKSGTAPKLIIDCTIKGKHHVYKEGLKDLKSAFKDLTKSLANEVAKDLLKAFGVKV